MDSKEGTPYFPMLTYLRSCKKESDKALEGDVQGEIPKWLKGNLIRLGSGLLEIGPDRYNHVFDGMALMHRFSFEDGRVTYQNRFLRSDAYKKNMKANRIVISGFATQGVPDPCKTIFQRFASLFSVDEMSDNDAIKIVPYADEVYACSETNYIWKIDPDTLESIEKVKLDQFVPVTSALAHVHEENDGTIYNVGSMTGLYCSFVILKFPPKESKDSSPFERGSAICTIPSGKLLNISYHHSFAMTEHYFVIVEQPLYLSISRLAWAHFVAGTYADAMHWDQNIPTRFHVVEKATGKLMDTVYVSKAFFVFHHINAYEEDNNIVVDMCCYEEGSVIQNMYLKALEEMASNSKAREYVEPFVCQPKRYVLPLMDRRSEKTLKENLVTLTNSDATAHQLPDGSIFCKPEFLITSEIWSTELPRINYEYYNGRKYKYFYAVARKAVGPITHILKADADSKKALLSWYEDGVIPSEPIFVAKPGQEAQEDAGVVLVTLLYKDDERKVAMLVLDAETMQEVGRVTFIAASAVPGDFHGTFLQKK